VKSDSARLQSREKNIHMNVRHIQPLVHVVTCRNSANVNIGGELRDGR
jgi:hypothetical protein